MLHTRPYRETSLLVTLLTVEAGIVSAVARGARSRRGHGLLPFRRLAAVWRGRTSLVTLSRYECLEAYPLAGAALGAGMYLNELLVRLVGDYDPVPALVRQYDETLRRLQPGGPLEPALRSFEKALLAELGYSIDFQYTAAGTPIAAEARYEYQAGIGFVAAPRGFSGAQLAAIDAGHFDDPTVLRSAKHLFRLALRPLLGPRPLVSRALFPPRAAVETQQPAVV